MKNIIKVMTGKKAWMGYEPLADSVPELPRICPAILSPVDGVGVKKLNEETIRRLNYFYAKDYSFGTDLEILWRGLVRIGK